VGDGGCSGGSIKISGIESVSSRQSGSRLNTSGIFTLLDSMEERLSDARDWSGGSLNSSGMAVLLLEAAG
jgi:hypothetical protein